MNSMQAGVVAFHEAMGQPVGQYAQPLPAERIPVRVELIREEFEDELIPALYSRDMIETADACIDIIYVTLGLLTEMGINAQPLFDEVQGSNMSKLGGGRQGHHRWAERPRRHLRGPSQKGAALLPARPPHHHPHRSRRH